MITNEDMKRLFGEDAELIVDPEEITYAVSIDFSATIMKLASEQGISLKELAERMGKSPQNLCKKLRGESNLTIKSMAEMAFALGYRIEAPELLPLEMGVTGKTVSANLHFEDMEFAVTSARSSLSQREPQSARLGGLFGEKDWGRVAA